MLWDLKIPSQSPLVLLVNIVCKQDESLVSEYVIVMGSLVLRTQPVSVVKGTDRFVT